MAGGHDTDVQPWQVAERSLLSNPQLANAYHYDEQLFGRSDKKTHGLEVGSCINGATRQACSAGQVKDTTTTWIPVAATRVPALAKAMLQQHLARTCFEAFRDTHTIYLHTMRSAAVSNFDPCQAWRFTCTASLHKEGASHCACFQVAAEVQTTPTLAVTRIAEVTRLGVMTEANLRTLVDLQD